LAGPVPDGQAQDAFPLALRHARLARVVLDAAVALCKQAEVPSAAQSFAVQAGLLQPAEWPNASEPLEQRAARKQSSKAPHVRAELLLPPEVAAEPQDEPEVQPLLLLLVLQAAQPAQQASQPQAEQSPGAQQARAEPVL
jgi:hypothetical protein